MRTTPEQLERIVARNGYGITSPIAKMPARPSAETESQAQQRVMKWWDNVYWHFGIGHFDARVLMAFPLQGARTQRNGARMKAEGLRAGTPDMLLAVARNGKHGLWIELKRDKRSYATEQQKMFIAMLERQGYAALVCHSADLTINAIQIYLCAAS